MRGWVSIQLGLLWQLGVDSLCCRELRVLLLGCLEGALSAECRWGGLWARAAKITFLIRNSRYKTGLKEHRPGGFPLAH